MKPKFTPGPWENENNLIVDSDGHSIAHIIIQVGIETSYSNTKLIIKAPEMYEMLKQLEWWHEGIGEECYCSFCGNHEQTGHEQNCALAKLLKEIEN